MSTEPSVILSPEEIREITGYRRPLEQLRELRLQGFWRARRSPVTGTVILERAHYEAVCSGAGPAPKTRTANPVALIKP